MKTAEAILERFSSPTLAWDSIERHQHTAPTAKMWVKQVGGEIGNDWAIVREVQEAWDPLNLN